MAERRQKVAEKVTNWVAEMVAEFPHLASDSATGQSEAGVAHLHLFTASFGACCIEPNCIQQRNHFFA